MVAADFHYLTVNLGRAKVRRVILNGRPYLVAPASLIVPGVLNGSDGALYYPPDETSKNHHVWNKIPIVVYHPQVMGEPVSASHTHVDVVESRIGFLRNSHYSDKLGAEAWFDEELTKNYDRKLSPLHQIHPRLEANEPIELSTGLFVDKDPTPGFCPKTGRAYDYIARNYRPDHLAVLPDQKGACSVADGCGVVMNQTKQEDSPMTPKSLWQKLGEVLGLTKNSNSEGCNQYKECGGGSDEISGKNVYEKMATLTSKKTAELEKMLGKKIPKGEMYKERLAQEILSKQHGAVAFEKALEDHATHNAGKYGNPQHGDTGKFQPHGSGTGKGPGHAAAVAGASGLQAAAEDGADASDDLGLATDAEAVESGTCPCGGTCDSCKGTMNSNPEGCNQYKGCGSGGTSGAHEVEDSAWHAAPSKAREATKETEGHIGYKSSAEATTKSNAAHRSSFLADKGGRAGHTTAMKDHVAAMKAHREAATKAFISKDADRGLAHSRAEAAHKEAAKFHQTTGREYVHNADEGGWVTLPNGVHIQVKDGEIVKGPKLTMKDVKEGGGKTAAEQKKVNDKKDKDSGMPQHIREAKARLEEFKNQEPGDLFARGVVPRGRSGENNLDYLSKKTRNQEPGDTVAVTKEADMALTAVERKAMVSGIVANCNCSGEVETLNKLSDATLIKLNAMPAALAKAKAMADKEDEMDAGADEDEENADGTKKKMPPQFAKNQMTNNQEKGKTMTDKEWLEACPPGIRTSVTNAMKIERKAKEEVIGQLLNNAEESKRESLGKFLGSKSLEELETLAEMLPPTRNVSEIDQLFAPVYLGASGGGREGSMAGTKTLNSEEDILPLPTTNWEEEEAARQHKLRREMA